ncbi:MBL fold metallo-hydrolase [bacterium]|nr:MBL fold metallo-hydrolase [bacterium]
MVCSPFQTNSYLIYNAQASLAVLIDPGDDSAAFAARLNREKLNLTAILLTHGHLDHVGAVAALQKQFNAKVFMHPADLPIMENGPELARNFGLPVPEPFLPDNELVDNQHMTVAGFEFTVLHTPGHTPGGVCFLSGEHLFAGDTLFAQSIGRTDLPGGNHDQLIAAIEQKLLPLPDNTIVHPGHGPDTTIGVEKVTNVFLA